MFSLKHKKLFGVSAVVALLVIVLAYCYCLPVTPNPDFASSCKRETTDILRNDSLEDRTIWQTQTYSKSGSFKVAGSQLHEELKRLGFVEGHSSISWREWKDGCTVVSLSVQSHISDSESDANTRLVLEVSRRQVEGLLSEFRLGFHKIIAPRH